MSIVVLAACAMSARPLIMGWRPAVLTSLVGAVIIQAYVVAVTLAIEDASVRTDETTYPRFVERCPPFTTTSSDGRCRVADRTSTIPVPGRTGSVASLSDDVFESVPDADGGSKVVEEKLARYLSPSEGDPEGLKNSQVWYRKACCAANGVPYPDLNVRCPSSSQLQCVDGRAIEDLSEETDATFTPR